MFVAPEHQGRGLGAALGRRFLAEAAAAGYRIARLDTGPLQHEAHRLYAASASAGSRPTTTSTRRWPHS